MGSQRYESGKLKKHPHIASFIASVAVEPTPELKSAIFSEANENISHRLFCMSGIIKIQTPGGCRISVSDAYDACKGMSVQLESGVDYDSMMKEFRNILDMLKHNFYKEEYLP